MKILYITYDDSNDINAWSGLTNTIYKFLSVTNEVITIDRLQSPIDTLFKIGSKVFQLFGYTSDYRRNEYFIKLINKRIQKRIRNLEYDVIFAPGILNIAYLSTKKPIVIWADATFKSLINSYPQYSNLPKSQFNSGNIIEKTALENCSKLIFSTTWAAKSAMEDYQINDFKIEIVPFGANLRHNNTSEDIENINKNKSQIEVKILFIGVDWKKKGGDLLLSIYSELRKLSDNYNLDVVGSSPDKTTLIEGVTFHGFLDKSVEKENSKLTSLLQNSHYFLLPTKAEAFGIVFCEANSYGLPAFGSDLGGIPDIIENGMNGELIDITKSPKELAQQIHDYITTGDYNEKSLRAFNHYKENFTWDKSIEKVNKILKELI